MNFSIYIAKRYLFAKSKNKAINYITAIAITGIIVGTAALFIVLSGASGLKSFTLKFTNLSDPDIKLLPTQHKTFKFKNDQAEKLKKINGIASFSEIVEDKALMRCEDKFLSVELKGVDVNYPKKTIDSILVYGDWFDQKSAHTVAGWGVSNSLGFNTYDLTKTIRLYVPKAGTGQILSPRNAFRSTKVSNVGIFFINDDLNNSLVFTGIENARYIFSVDNESVSSIEITLEGKSYSSEVKEELEELFKGGVLIKDRAQLNEALYKMLNTEQLVVYLIFTLILIIALFNIIGSIIMIIIDKRKNIKTLFSLGATKKRIQNIFFLQGLLMTFFGGSIGLFIGFIVVLLQQQFNLIFIAETIPYPVDLNWNNVTISFLTILTLGLFASFLASASVRKFDYSD